MPSRGREARIRVGVVPQMDNLDPDFTVRENLLIYGRVLGCRATSLESRIRRSLDFAGLSSKRDAAIRALSGGMKRRLACARAHQRSRAPDPRRAHDGSTRRRGTSSGTACGSRAGKTILLTTHFMDEAERLATRPSR